MLLDWIDTVGLLPKEADSNVLASFPPAIRRSIISEVTNCMFQTGTVAGMANGHGENSPSDSGLASLSSPFHVRWVMEVLGQAFTLPLEDMNIVSNAAAIYVQWLIEPSRRPPAVQRASEEDQQAFLQSLFRHVSLLFAPKRVDGVGAAKPLLATLASKHVELCRLMLGTLAQHASKGLPTASWDVLLKVLLGVADSLLKLPVSPACYLAEELGDGLLAMLTEHWLRSSSVSPSLWRAMRTLYPRWTHRSGTVAHWSALCLGLTQHVARLLYGPAHGAPAVSYAAAGSVVTLELPAAFVVDAWQQMLAVVGPADRIPPAVFFRAVAGIERLVGVFLALPADDAPATNTLMHVFGRWLLTAAARTEPECTEGRAQAIGALCRIVVRPQPAGAPPVLTAYLAHFYGALESALSGDLLALVFAVVGCEDLFALALPGARTLVPAFVDALRRLTPAMERPLRVNLDAADLRRACYKLLATMHALCGHYASVTIAACSGAAATGADTEWSAAIRRGISATCARECKTLGEVRAWIADTLVASLIAERDASNLCYLLGALGAHVLDAADAQPGIVPLAAEVLSRQALAAIPQGGVWSADIAILAADVLRQLARACPAGEVSQFAPRLVSVLCEIAESLLSRSATHASVIVALLDAADAWALQTRDGGVHLASADGHKARHALLALLRRAMVNGAMHARKASSPTSSAATPNSPPTVPSMPISSGTASAHGAPLRLPRRSPSQGSVAASVRTMHTQPIAAGLAVPGALAAATAALVPHAGRVAPEHAVAAAAEVLLMRLVANAGGQSINPRFPTSVSSSLSAVTGTNIRHYVLGGGAAIVSIAERALPEDSPLAAGHASEPRGVTVVMRSAAGRAAYASTLRYVLDAAPFASLLSAESSSDVDICGSDSLVAAKSGNASSTGSMSVDDRLAVNLQVVSGLVHTQALRTAQSLAATKPALAPAARPPRAAPAADAPLGRMFLAHTSLMATPSAVLSGLADARAPLRLPACPELDADMEILDALPERACIGITVFCATPTDDFAAFVSALGWPVDMSSHAGFRGRLGEGTAVAQAAPYWADADVEVLFHVLPHGLSVPAAERAQAAAFVSAADLVCVVWAADGASAEAAAVDDAMAALPASRAAVFIVVAPAADAPGLYRIRIMVSSAAVSALSSGPHTASTDSLGGLDASSLAAHHPGQPHSQLLFGPLLDGMVVRRDALARLVRETAVSAARHLSQAVQGAPRPLARRAAFIQHIVNKYRAVTMPAKYFNELLYPV